MTTQNNLKLAAFAAAVAFSSVASATVSDLTDQYVLHTSYVQNSAHEYTFNYTVDNIGQGYAGSQTGLDGFTIYIPTSATVISKTPPAPYIAGSIGYWDIFRSDKLDLRGDGSQNMVAPAGYEAYTFWGQYTESVYQLGHSATFSITLGNVSLGTNTVGISSYYGYATPPAGQQYTTNEYGNYTTFTTSALSAVTAVPEPETYAMLLAGLGIVGFMARRRQA